MPKHQQGTVHVNCNLILILESIYIHQPYLYVECGATFLISFSVDSAVVHVVDALLLPPATHDMLGTGGDIAVWLVSLVNFTWSQLDMFPGCMWNLNIGDWHVPHINSGANPGPTFTLGSDLLMLKAEYDQVHRELNELCQKYHHLQKKHRKLQDVTSSDQPFEQEPPPSDAIGHLKSPTAISPTSLVPPPWLASEGLPLHIGPLALGSTSPALLVAVPWTSPISCYALVAFLVELHEGSKQHPFPSISPNIEVLQHAIPLTVGSDGMISKESGNGAELEAQMPQGNDD
ncbi:hypothetical protein HD554DRAFT_2041844 [Boletus coccyginus]|nr:hypothetical protein HD554DRAFT_2041844 [Boletus coccyginus]